MPLVVLDGSRAIGKKNCYGRMKPSNETVITEIGNVN